MAASAQRTTMGAFDVAQGLGEDPLISSDRPVWVVTVHGYMETDAAPGQEPVVHNDYTEVYDAPTGDLIMTAIGVDAAGQ
jgi:hypothetical protein